MFETEALVGGHPGDDRRMISIAADHVGPLRRQPSFGLGGAFLKARHLIPDQKPKPIRPVEPPRVFDLLVLPGAIEAEPLGRLDVDPQRLVAGRRQQAARKVALVEHQTLHERFAVQPDAAVMRAHAAQPEIGEHPVEDPAAAVSVEQRRFDLVKRR